MRKSFYTLVTIFVLLLIFIACLSPSQESNCELIIYEEPQNQPLFCHEITFELVEKKGKFSGIIHNVKKYTFNDLNKIVEIEENSDFSLVNLEKDSTIGYALKKFEYDSTNTPKSIISYDSEGKIISSETFSRVESNRLKSRFYTSKYDRTYFIDYHFDSCSLSKYKQVDSLKQYEHFTEVKSRLVEESSVHFASSGDTRKFTISKEEVEFDENGNWTEITERRSDKENIRKIYRKYYYSEDELLEFRSIDEVIELFINSLRKKDFSELVEDAYFLGEEVIMSNPPFPGKDNVFGFNWLMYPNKDEILKRINQFHLDEINRLRLDWENIKLDSIEDKLISEIKTNSNKNLFFSKCFLHVSDNNRKTTFHLKFLRVHKKWYMYLEK